MDVSDRTLTSLGFDDVRAAIGSRCRTEVGKARGIARPFLDGIPEVLASLELVDVSRPSAQRS